MHCICDLAPYIFENIHGTKPQIEGTVRHNICYVDRIVEIGVRQRNIRTQSHFLKRTRFSPYKNPSPLCFELTRLHCICIFMVSFQCFIKEQAAH